MNLKHCFAAFAVSCLAMGCASTNTVESTVRSPAAAQMPISGAETVAATPVKKLLSDASVLVTHIPDGLVLPGAENSASVIKSGKDDNGVWVEGRGIFKGSLEEVYADLINPLVIGPVHLTKDITVSNIAKSEFATTYQMHVRMKYIFSIEFTLNARVEALYEGDAQKGWEYYSSKCDGTRFISKADTRLVIRDIGAGLFSVEFQSLNEATMDKEDEARQHLETLFKYWKDVTDKRSRT